MMTHIVVDAFLTSTITISVSSLPQTTKAPSKSKPSNSRLLRSSRHQLAIITAAESSVKTLVPLPSPSVKTITSTSNPFVKHCIKLRQSSSYRHEHGSVVVVGSTPIREIYNFQEATADGSVGIKCLIVLENADIPEEIGHSSRVICVSSSVMKKLSGLQSVDSIDMIALMRIPPTFHDVRDHPQSHQFSLFSHPQRLLVLDGIQDPGNLGTLMRSALAFRWDGAYLLPGCCDPFNEKALRASRGATFRFPIVSGDWNYLKSLRGKCQLKMLAGHPADNGKSRPVSLLSQSFAGQLADIPLCLVLGSEGSGLSEETREVCELQISFHD